MREMETDRQESHELRLLRQQRKKQRTRQMVIPKPAGRGGEAPGSTGASSSDTVGFERQLRKLATRGGDFSHLLTLPAAIRLLTP